MKKAKERFNKYAEQIEDAQTEIRKIIVMAFLLSIPFFSLNRLIKNIVVEYTDNIKIPDLKDGAVRGLIAFANRQNAEIRKIGLKPKTVKFIADNKDRRFPTKPTENVIKDLDMPPVTDLGVPLKQYYQEVFKTKIKPTLDRLCEQVALDPNDLTGRNSLRNFAEMEVRYNDHLEQIEELKNSGVKIAASSAHADCSDRCAPWQGRLYSLDGTSGKIDGKEYVPLEMATDIYYTTKAGKVYKNGLLGFNCRHYLEKYEGKMLPTISAEERKIEYGITIEQRRLERLVRRERIKAAVLNNIDTKGYQEAKRKAAELYLNYKRYSINHNRAFYPMRTKI